MNTSINAQGGDINISGMSTVSGTKGVSIDAKSSVTTKESGKVTIKSTPQ